MPLELLMDVRVAEEGMRIDRAQETGALHSRTIENKITAPKKARARRLFFIPLQ